MTAEPSTPAEPSPTVRHPDRLKLPGWALALIIAVFATAALTAASLRWIGVVIIVALVAGVCALLLRWTS